MTETLTQPVAPATEQAPAAPAEPEAWMKPGGGPAFTANRGELLAAVAAAAGVINRPQKPVLACLRLDASAAGGLTIEATDLNQWAWHPVAKADAQRPGVCLAPADKLLAALRESAADCVTVESTGGRLIVTEAATGTSKPATVRLFGMDPDLWPSAGGDARPDPLGTVAAAELRRIVAQALSTDPEAGTSVKGILVQTEGKAHDALLLCGTDGRRLAVARAAWDGKPVPPTVVPIPALKLAAKAAEGEDGDRVGLWADERGIVFYTPGLTLRSALIESRFPPYADVFPPNCPVRVTFPRDAFCGRIRQAALTVDESTNCIRCEFGPWGTRFTSRSAEVGEAAAELACEWEGPAEGLTIGFSHNYLRAAVAACAGETVTLELTSPGLPGLVTDGGSDYRHCLMPIGLQ